MEMNPPNGTISQTLSDQLRWSYRVECLKIQHTLVRARYARQTTAQDVFAPKLKILSRTMPCKSY